MRYPPELVDTLAAEYVIGTLHGAARRRFEGLMRLRADVRYSVWSWEKLLSGLAVGITPVRPPRSVWLRIRRRIDAPKSSPIIRLRPGLATVTAALAIFAFWLGTVVPTGDVLDAPEHMAVFADAESRPLWIISVDTETGRLVTETAGVPPADGGLVHELWALPDGGTPRSLGLLTTVAGRYETALASDLVAAIEQSAALAISLEPAGGSPTGLPTGPVVHRASLVRL